jgi:hypothetical protein
MNYIWNAIPLFVLIYRVRVPISELLLHDLLAIQEQLASFIMDEVVTDDVVNLFSIGSLANPWSLPNTKLGQHEAWLEALGKVSHGHRLRCR